ncbi:MAG: T9SS type A sorting domain-containing protein, partial [Flavobacteriales bacterium]
VNFNIFPNPSNTFFELDYSGKEEAHFEIRLTDLQGSLVTVLSENEQLAPKQKKRFDISDVAKGVYLIQLVNENNIYSRKLIVQ